MILRVIFKKNMYELNFKKYFFRTLLVVALSISALIGIFIFLFGDFGETEIRLLLTTLTIGCFSLTGLCSSSIHKRNKLRIFSEIGIIISILGSITTVGAIWEIIDFNEIWKTMVIFIILSVTIGYISLLLRIRPRTDRIKYLLTGTIVFISIVSLMLIKSTLSEFNENEFYFRLLGVFSILNVLGTIATPLMNRTGEKNE